jgi:hypothetical protein
VNAVLNLRVPQNTGNLSSCCTVGGLSSSARLHRLSQPLSFVKLQFNKLAFLSRGFLLTSKL